MGPSLDYIQRYIKALYKSVTDALLHQQISSRRYCIDQQLTQRERHRRAYEIVVAINCASKVKKIQIGFHSCSEHWSHNLFFQIKFELMWHKIRGKITRKLNYTVQFTSFQIWYRSNTAKGTVRLAYTAFQHKKCTCIILAVKTQSIINQSQIKDFASRTLRSNARRWLVESYVVKTIGRPRDRPGACFGDIWRWFVQIFKNSLVKGKNTLYQHLVSTNFNRVLLNSHGVNLTYICIVVQLSIVIYTNLSLKCPEPVWCK